MTFVIPDFVKTYDGKAPILKKEDDQSECSELIKDALRKMFPNTSDEKFKTSNWTPGIKLDKDTLISSGTAIAAFSENGKYENVSGRNHAAIFVKKTQNAIEVLEQYNKIDKIKRKSYPFGGVEGKPRTYNANNYSTIEISNL